ncbi:MAG: putative sulfate exporter family transporter [Acidobacteria bacterium]|nr:putative sulfate exporter family transporter [Acidobacteriota bacterium]
MTLSWYAWRHRIPGIACAAAVATAGKWLATVLSMLVARMSGLDPAGHDAQSLVSAISVAVALGLVWRNAVGIHELLRPGLIWVIRTGLRFGIVLLGFKLALGTAGQISRTALPVVAVCIASALLMVTYFNNRLGLPRRLGALIAVGTSVCGVTAIIATGPAIGATDDETSYAVACITIFGLLAMFTYPWVAHAVFGTSPMIAGIFLGTSIHDTSQVAGASLMYSETFSAPLALQAATVTKLLRNMSMAVLVPIIAMRLRADRRRPTLKDVRAAVPGFVLLFLAAIAARTLGDAVLAGSRDALANWNTFLGAANTTSTWALTVALAGIGLSTDLAKLRGLGLKPLLVGLVAAVSVGVVSFLSLSLLTRLG